MELKCYYPGGMGMPGRIFNSSSYRYGFQNQEIDREFWGGAVAFEYRVEDPRLVRFFSVDPLADDYPHNSPYAFAENRLIDGIELEGLEWKPTQDKEGNTTDYSWVGYNNDGTPKAGSKSGGIVSKGNYNYLYASDAKSQKGWLDIFSRDKTATFSNGETTDRSAMFNYSFEFQQTNGATIGGGWLNIKADVWNEEGTVAADLNVRNGVGTAVNLKTADLFYKVRSDLGLTIKPTAIESDGLGPIDYMIGLGELKTVRASSKIIGSAQTTGTKGHAFTSKLVAWRYALDPRVERVTLDLGYKKLLGGGAFKWGPRPDVGVLFRSGRVKTFEIMSKTDIDSRLFNRNFLFMQRNSIQGNTRVLKPFSLKSLYK